MERACAVRFTRRYAATPARVWRALTDPESLRRWLGPLAADVPAWTRALEVERLLELEWRPPGETPSLVRFQLRPDGDGTVLVLDHERIDAAGGMRALGRWETHLRRLDAAVGAPSR